MAGTGGKRPGAGRKSKAEELKIANTAMLAIKEKYGSLEAGFRALLDSKEQALIRWVFEHAAGKPQDKVDMTSGGEVISGHTVTFRDFSKKE